MSEIGGIAALHTRHSFSISRAHIRTVALAVLQGYDFRSRFSSSHLNPKIRVISPGLSGRNV